MDHRTCLAASIAGTVLAVGCSWGTYDGSYLGGPSTGGGGSRTIDGAGGTVTSADGSFSLDIPPGAIVGSGVMITITPAPQGSGTFNNTYGPSYTVAPMGLRFAKPIGALFHESAQNPQNAYTVTVNHQALPLGGMTYDQVGAAIFGITDQLGEFAVTQGPSMTSAAACSSVPGTDACGACAKSACLMTSGARTVSGDSQNCLCVTTSRADSLVQELEGCGSTDGATGCVSDIPQGGAPSASRSVSCGPSTCDLNQGQSCCGGQGNPRVCSNGTSTCNTPSTCDEAADCAGSPGASSCCGSISGGDTKCVARGTCSLGGQIQYCRTNSECPLNVSCMVKSTTKCVLETCGGSIPMGWPPPECR